MLHFPTIAMRVSGAGICALLWATNVNAAGVKYYETVVPAASTGTDTGVAFTTGQTVSVKASGYVFGLEEQPIRICKVFNPTYACWSNPNGSGDNVANLTDPDCLVNSLIGTIAGSDTYHCLGTAASFQADADGDLILLTNDSFYPDNIGTFVVLVQAPGK